MPDARTSLRSVALPAEHGGWSFTLEPALLGLLIAPSGAGVALTGAALVAFLLRTPLRLVLVDGRRHRHLPRTALAWRVCAVEATGLVALAVVAVLTATAPFWWPLAIAAPLVLVELGYDMRSRSRRLAPELAGTAALGAVAAAIVLAAGEPDQLAAGLWVVAAARALATVPFVRHQVRRVKSQPSAVWTSDAAQVCAIGLAAAGAALGWTPVAGAAAIVALGVFQLVAVRLAPPKVGIIGAQQVVAGLVVVTTTALGALAP